MPTVNLPHFRSIFLLWATLVLVLPSYGQIATSRIFSDNMVLQRNQPIHIWGTAPAGTQVNLRLHTQLSLAFADAQGNWEAVLGSLPAGGPYQLLIESPVGDITYSNIAIGEVWICAGQSNMERPLKLADNGTAEAASANWPNIRFFTVPNVMSAVATRQLTSGQWLICTPETAKDFSGTGFYFGKHLYQNLNIPIGLIDITWGGTQIDTWISPQGHALFPDMQPALSALANLDIEEEINAITTSQEAWDQQLELQDIGLQQNWSSPNVSIAGWGTMMIPKSWESDALPGRDGSVWFKRTFTLTTTQAASDIQLSIGRVDDSDQTWVNGHLVGSTALNPGLVRTYNVPASYLLAGENQITIRVRDYGYTGGLLGGSSDMKVQRDIWQVPLAGNWYYKVGTPNLGNRPLDFAPSDYPSLIFNGMIGPLLGLRMAGVIWYQGESDSGNPFHYRDKQIRIIDDWRSHWGIGNFPFITTQLTAFRPTVSQPGASSWATLRESQFFTLKRSNTAIACLIDEGEAYDIHL
ncbi:MAG: sialate O-acetylesterase [Saprospiraceae bacterium]